jgi:hypothetical protein
MIETRIKTVKTVIRIYRHNILNGINPVENRKDKKRPNRFNGLLRSKK